MHNQKRITTISLVFAAILSACGPGEQLDNGPLGQEPTDGVSATACTSCEPEEPQDHEVRMPTSANAGMTESKVVSLVGQPISTGSLSPSGTRYTYCAETCTSGGWCLGSQYGACTPYAIDFQNGLLTKAAAFVPLTMRVTTNISGVDLSTYAVRWCRASLSYTDASGSSSGAPVDRNFPAVAQHTESGTMYVYPGSTVHVRSFCQNAQTGGERAEAASSFQMTSAKTWGTTYTLSGAGNASMAVTQP